MVETGKWNLKPETSYFSAGHASSQYLSGGKETYKCSAIL